MNWDTEILVKTVVINSTIGAELPALVPIVLRGFSDILAIRALFQFDACGDVGSGHAHSLSNSIAIVNTPHIYLFPPARLSRIHRCLFRCSNALRPSSMTLLICAMALGSRSNS